jgi:two-component system, OmpR family, sensor histidine kinase VicK
MERGTEGTGEAARPEKQSVAMGLPRETRFVTGRDEVIDEIRRLYLTSRKLSICATYDGFVGNRNTLGDVFMELAERCRKGDHEGIRFITSIDRKQQSRLLGTFLGLGFQIRHMEAFPSVSFSIVGDEIGDTVIIGLWNDIVVSGEPSYVRHFRSIFEEQWGGGVDASRRMGELESETGSTTVETIGNSDQTMKRITDLFTQRDHEVSMMLSTPNALRRFAKAGLFQTIDDLVGRNAMTVRVLVPSDIEIRSPLREGGGGSSKLEFKRIDESLMTRFTMLIIDREHSFILETRDDTREDLNESLGVTTYTESRSIAASYSTIFETLWKQAEMFEKLRAHEEIQDEFVNIAAHELRTPLQVIVNSVELAAEGDELGQFGAIAIEGAKRLQRLTQDLLDIQRIDRNTLQLRRELFAVESLLSKVVREQELGLRSKKTSILYEPGEGGGRALVEADEERLAQVLSNLLSNALEFTEEGTISVKLVNQADASGSRQVTVEIRDTGKGIDPGILPVLFSKFASKSRTGSGLGLYIARGIVQAHGGTIWGRNNEDGKGATFGFTLPSAETERAQTPGESRDSQASVRSASDGGQVSDRSESEREPPHLRLTGPER